MSELIDPPPVEVKVEDAKQQQEQPQPGTPEYLKGLAHAFSDAYKNNNSGVQTPEAKQPEKPLEQEKKDPAKIEEPEKPPVETPQQKQEPQALTAEQLLAEFNKVNGTSFESVDSVKAALSERDNLKNIVQAFSELSEEERAILKAGRENKDYSFYSRVMSIDTNAITPKEAIRQRFILENPGRSQEYLNEKFEREFRAKYIVPEPEDAEDEDYKKDKRFAELSLQEDEKDARKFIEAKQQELKKYGTVEGVANHAERQKAVQEKTIELRTAWTAAVDKKLSNSDKVSYTVTPKDSTDSVPVILAMDAAQKAEVRAAMDDPMSFLQKEIGYNPENHTFDPDKLYEYVLRNIASTKLRDIAFTAGANWKYEQIKKATPGANIPPAPDGDAKLTREEDAKNAGKQIEAQRGTRGHFG